MANSIPLIGLSASDFVPGTYVSVNLGVGLSTGVGSPISILLMGNKLASAPMTTDSVVYGPDVQGFTIASEADVISNAGQGSELHLMYRQIAKVNNITPVYMIAVAEGAGVAASLAVTFTTTATAAGFVRSYVTDVFVDTNVNAGDTPTVVAAAVAASINAVPYLTVTASAAIGVLTITAKNKGLRSNKIRVAVRMNGVTGMTSSAQAFTYLAGGTVADSFTSALATVLPKKFQYIVTGTGTEDSGANLGLLNSQVATQALPVNNIRQRVVTGSVDSIGTATTFGIATNKTRCEIVWQPNSNLLPCQLAAKAAAAYTLGEDSTVPLLNWDNLGASPVTAALWATMPSQFDGSAPTRADIASALSSGVSPITSVNGSSFLVSRVTSYCRDSFANLDTRVRDAHIVTVMDLFAATLQSKIQQQFANKLIAADPLKGGKTPGSQVVTPIILAAAINKLIRQFGENSLLQNVEASVLVTQTLREASPDSRMSARVQLQPISLAHQFAINLDQTSF